MNKPIEAMTPKEMIDLKMSRIPEKVFEAFNEAIADNLSGKHATVTQEEVVTLIVSKLECSQQAVFDNGWLDVEPFYRKKGWTVTYDKPGYNESYSAYWEFKHK